jgi:hypothetical protein
MRLLYFAPLSLTHMHVHTQYILSHTTTTAPTSLWVLANCCAARTRYAKDVMGSGIIFWKKNIEIAAHKTILLSGIVSVREASARVLILQL